MDNKLMSNTINFLRFPLTVAVVYIHLCKKRSISTHPKRGYPFTFLTCSS